MSRRGKRGVLTMIRVTIWYEYAQEAGDMRTDLMPQGKSEEEIQKLETRFQRDAANIHAVYPKGLMETLAEALKKNPDFSVRVTNLYMPEYGLSDEILNSTDVLIYWAHVMHDAIPDEVAFRIVRRVQSGMGFIPLHSAHKSKPFMFLLGTSGTLSWREGDFCRVWTVSPTHPIAEGIPEHFELPEEEMYSEPFDIPTPDDVVFISWYRGGEVFRSGCTWRRGYGKIFYFQPGHETNPSYHNAYVIRIIENAVRWAAPALWRKDFVCRNALDQPEQNKT